MSSFGIGFADKLAANNFLEGINDFLKKDEPLSIVDTVEFAKEFRTFNSTIGDWAEDRLDFGWNKNDLNDISVVTSSNTKNTSKPSNFVYKVMFPDPHDIPVYKDLKIQLVGGSDEFTLTHIKDFAINSDKNYLAIIKSDTRKIYIPLTSLLFMEEV